MSLRPQLLVLAPAPVGGRIAAQAGDGGALAVADPYDALIEMGKRPWPAVVLAASPADLPAVARASRRLQKQARIVALCGSADEQEVQPLAGAVLDDYLIDPPTRGEVAGLLRLSGQDAQGGQEEEDRTMASGKGPPRASGPGDVEALSGGELAAMIEAARNSASLESAVAKLVSARLGEPVAWVDSSASEAPADEVLLRLENPPRALTRCPGPGSLPGRGVGEAGPSEDRADRAAVEPLLSALKKVLPSLSAAARRTEVFRRLSITDDLTGLYNRRYFYQVAGEILLWSRQKGSRATLLLYDIDNFKQYNEEFGHPTGDEILREMAVLIKQVTRSQDVVARVGGEEFAVLFWESEPPRTKGSRPVETPYRLADRFRRAVTSHRFPALGPKAKGALTISGGLATFPRDGANVEDLMRQADDALRAAKRSGKNAIRIIGPD
jgi:diguanylate cyclase (GGDEF)-like protein